MRYAVSNWIYGDEQLERTFGRLRRFGYDGIEIKGEPDDYDPAEVRRLSREYGIPVTSIAGWVPWPTDSRDLAHVDPAVRNRAVGYFCRCVDFASAVGAEVVIVVPAAVPRLAPVGFADDPEVWPRLVEAEWRLAVESVRRAADYAQRRGVTLAIEPINRFETFLVTTAAQALQFLDQVGSQAVKIHLDTFHMNIEEADPAAAIRQAGSRLASMHVSDSNRLAVGDGHTDFRALLSALGEVGFGGPLVLEPLPPVPNAFVAARLQRLAGLRDTYAEVSLRRLKELERSLRQSAS
jgi:sugar phosphate isomerase/epimerase